MSINTWKLCGAVLICLQGSTLVKECYAESRDFPPLIVLAASEDAEGVTQRDLDLAALKGIEARTLEKTRSKVAEAFRANGIKTPPPRLYSEAHYTEIGKLKLAVVRITSPGAANQAHVYGIIGRELKRVICIRTTNLDESIPLFSGPCGAKVREVFGISLQ